MGLRCGTCKTHLSTVEQAREHLQKCKSSALPAGYVPQTMTHLLALLEGLEVPNPEWWLQQPPEAIRELGKSIAAQAKAGA